MSKQIIWNYFKEKGFTDWGVAGLMGNIQAESNFKPTNLQQSGEKRLNMTDESYTKAVDNGTYTNFVRDSAGYGLAQWTYWSRKQNLLNFVKESGKSIGDLRMQLDFLYHELKGYPEVLKVLENARDVKSASDIVLLKYERPADQSEKALNKRATYGENIYKEFTSVHEETPTEIKNHNNYDYVLTALNVIEGAFGNGNDRVNNLKNMGYDPGKIQRIVNAILS